MVLAVNHFGNRSSGADETDIVGKEEMSQ